MGKISFDESGRNFLEIRLSGDEVEIIMSARDTDNPRKNRVNTVSVSKEQFSELIKDIDTFVEST